MIEPRMTHANDLGEGDLVLVKGVWYICKGRDSGWNADEVTLSRAFTEGEDTVAKIRDSQSFMTIPLWVRATPEGDALVTRMRQLVRADAAAEVLASVD